MLFLQFLVSAAFRLNNNKNNNNDIVCSARSANRNIQSVNKQLKVKLGVKVTANMGSSHQRNVKPLCDVTWSAWTDIPVFIWTGGGVMDADRCFYTWCLSLDDRTDIKQKSLMCWIPPVSRPRGTSRTSGTSRVEAVSSPGVWVN